jgi:D-glycero-alpha-D-manno-heptose-7-phosphate kinase
MIITKTPFRISFVGGGSDLPEFYHEHPGAVLSTTINKYMYISSHKYFEHDKIRMKYSKTETVKGIDEITHPIFKEALKMFQIQGGLELSSIADVPSGTGMGSSSSFTVGLLHNLYAIKGEHVSKERLAKEACEIEIERLGEPIGKQDQYAAAYGGLNIFRFNTDETVSVEKVYLNKTILSDLEDNLIMFYTGSQRKANEILTEQKSNTKSADKKATLIEMTHLVDELKIALTSNKLDDFGKLLHENWLLKRGLASKISNNDIDDAYTLAMNNGALGGKLLGAGGGGFLLFYCIKEKQTKLIEAMKRFRRFPFGLEHEGSKVIYFGDEKDA